MLTKEKGFLTFLVVLGDCACSLLLRATINGRVMLAASLEEKMLSTHLESERSHKFEVVLTRDSRFRRTLSKCLRSQCQQEAFDMSSIGDNLPSARGSWKNGRLHSSIPGSDVARRGSGK